MASSLTPTRRLGRYLVYDELASGGLGSVHLARLLGPGGFARTVAIKRLHPQFAKDPDFVTLFLDEARLATRVQHPNVAQTVDVVTEGGEVFLVMDYVHGEPLSRLLRAATEVQGRPDPSIVSAIVLDALRGLHAAHEAVDERGEPLVIVHRDVSPHNIMVGADGIARVVDFGVAKASLQAHTTRAGVVKGKFGYMSPEQLMAEPVDRRADLFSAGVVLWETLTGRRLYAASDAGAAVAQILYGEIEPPTKVVPSLTAEVDSVVMRALSREPNQRFQTAEEMSGALRDAIPPASDAEVSAWVEEVSGDALTLRKNQVLDAEADSGTEHAVLSFSGIMPKHVQSPRPTDGGRARASERPTVVDGAPGATPASRRTRTGILIAVGVALAGLVAWAVLGGRQDAGPEPIAHDPVVPVSSRAPAASASSPPATSFASAEPAPPAPSAAASTPPPKRVSPTQVTRKVRRPSKRQPNCDPPFRINARGVKEFKPECF